MSLCTMVEKLTIVICHYGGHFVTTKDGSMQYMGGGAKAFDIQRSTTVIEMTSELASEMRCDPSTLKLRYFLPGDMQTPLNIVIDRDLQRMVDFHGDSKTIHVYVLSDSNLDCDPLVIDGRHNKAVVGDCTSSAGPTSSPLKCQMGESLNFTYPIDGKQLLSSSWDKVIIGVGQEFKSAKEFRCALGKFAVACGFHFNFVKNDSNRVTAKCSADNCKWRLHASKLPRTQVFKIKKYENSHTCDGGLNVVKRPQATKHWVADVIKDKLIDSPQLKPRDIIKELHQEYGIELRYHQAWRGMELAKVQLQGPPLMEYDNLRRICQMIMNANPGSHTVMRTTGQSRFKSLFVCFYASQFGFNEGCRPVLFLSSMSLDDHEETLLCATSIDADDGMFPVAFAIVDSEDEPNWNSFLDDLKQVISLNRRITFISSGQMDLVNIISEVFQDSYHAFCMNHLCECFRYEVKGGISAEAKDYIVGQLWKAAYATNIFEFDKEINDISKISEEAVNWIRQSRPDHWSNAFFEGNRYNHMTADVTKLFSEWVLEVKNLPLSEIIHQIGSRIMELMYGRHLESEKWQIRLVPSAEMYLRHDIVESQMKQILHSSGDDYEVSDIAIRVVNINGRTCSCKQWQMLGRPCSHAIAVLNQIGLNPYDFCSPYLTTEIYRLSYSRLINPIPDYEDCAEDEKEMLVKPPRLKRKPGRPKKQKIKPVAESRNVHCSRCGGNKHNKLTCKEPIQNLLQPVQNCAALAVGLM